jgi:hypothetical protein
MLQREVWKEQGTLEYLTPCGYLVLKHLRSGNKFLDFKGAYPLLFDNTVSFMQLQFHYNGLLQIKERPILRRLERKVSEDVNKMNWRLEEIRQDRLANRESEDEVFNLSDSEESIARTASAAVQGSSQNTTYSEPVVTIKAGV